MSWQVTHDIENIRAAGHLTTDNCVTLLRDAGEAPSLEDMRLLTELQGTIDTFVRNDRCAAAKSPEAKSILADELSARNKLDVYLDAPHPNTDPNIGPPAAALVAPQYPHGLVYGLSEGWKSGAAWLTLGAILCPPLALSWGFEATVGATAIVANR